MIYVFLGLAVLVISFLIALLTLIREQRQAEGERDALEEQPPQAPPFSEKTEVPTPQIPSANSGDNLQNSGNLEAALPYPWDQKSQESVVPPGVGEINTDAKADGNGEGDGDGDLIRGGEFIIPRSADRE